MAVHAHIGWDILLKEDAVIDDTCMTELEYIGHEETKLVSRFIEKATDNNISTDVKSRFIKLALKQEDTGLHVLELISKSIDMNDVISREVALQKASLFGQIGVVKDFLAQSDLDINFCGPETQGLTALHSASMNGHIDFVRLLIDHGAALDLKDSMSDNYKGFHHPTAFMLALLNGHMEVVMLLVNRGANLNALDDCGHSALHMAAHYGVSMVEYILHSPRFHQTVSVSSTANITVLMMAVIHGNMDNVEYVLKRSSLSDVLARYTNSNYSDIYNGYTALHFAVYYQSPRAMIEILIQSGLDMSLETKLGEKPLHIAAGIGNLSARNPFRYTSIVDHAAYVQDIASRWSLPSVRPLNQPIEPRLSVLLSIIHGRWNHPHQMFHALQMYLPKPGINLEPKDAEGRSPLVVLCQKLAKADEPDQCDNWTTLHNSINLLIRCGADVLSQDARGNTALHYIYVRACGKIYGVDQSPLELLCIDSSENQELIRSMISYQRPEGLYECTEDFLLHLACLYGSIAVTEELLSAGWSTETTNENGYTPIILAIVGGEESTVEILLAYRAHLSNEMYRFGDLDLPYHPLEFAKTATMCRLIDSKGLSDWLPEALEHREKRFEGGWVSGITSDPNEPSSYSGIWDSKPILGTSVLHVAAYRGNIEAIEFVIVEKHLRVNARASLGLTPLFFAIFGDQESVVKMLLQHGADANECYGPIKVMPLHVAVAAENVSVIEMLMSHGADPHLADVDGWTPYMVAWLNYEDYSMVQALENSLSSAAVLHDGLVELADHFVDASVTVKGAIMESCAATTITELFPPELPRRGSIVVETLKYQQSLEGSTSLDLATGFGYSKLVQKILNRSQPFIPQILRALHTAVLNNHTGCVRILLHRLAVQSRHKNCLEAEHTVITHPEYLSAPLLFAEHNGSLRVRHEPLATVLNLSANYSNDSFRVINELLSHGVDLEARDQYGDTSLHHALLNGNLKVAMTLIFAGANVNSLSGGKQSPIQLAVVHCAPSTVVLLHNFGTSLETDLYNRGDLLSVTIQRSSPEMVHNLMESGMDLNMEDHTGVQVLLTALKYLEEDFVLESLPESDVIRYLRLGTTLSQASAQSLSKIVSVLLSREFKISGDVEQYVNHAGEDGAPLYLAAIGKKINSRVECMELLIRHSAKINLVSGPQGSPLMAACYYDAYDSVVCLLMHGANTTCKKLNGIESTTMQLAYLHKDIMILLQSFQDNGPKAL
ncbi:hypothetical protein BOTNAR_0500g00010 [Botryotinia narcissicola]|uniref:Uncharacterized protein n=1 Tax=Botryotinia narcissicola TaxID=278944 RepID=A0A4Z1HG86_9HELO|nr:hypothetical protein BOTNAR_0500g00010 [Botryotinia narcissicola]